MQFMPCDILWAKLAKRKLEVQPHPFSVSLGDTRTQSHLFVHPWEQSIDCKVFVYTLDDKQPTMILSSQISILQGIFFLLW